MYTLCALVCCVCRSVFKHDNYTPMVVETDDQYQGVLDVFPYRDFDLEKAPFPKRFPFSSFVPQIYTLLKNFVNSMIDYGHDLNIRYVCVYSEFSLNLPPLHPPNLYPPLFPSTNIIYKYQ